VSDEKSELRQRCSQLETDNRVLRAALAKAQEELAKVAPEAKAEAPRRGRPPKVAAE
jgi:hypothetical protein